MEMKQKIYGNTKHIFSLINAVLALILFVVFLAPCQSRAADRNSVDHAVEKISYVREVTYLPSHPVYRPSIKGYRRIHRQQGRRYINDYPCAPVIVVPAKHHRHSQSCRYKY